MTTDNRTVRAATLTLAAALGSLAACGSDSPDTGAGSTTSTAPAAPRPTEAAPRTTTAPKPTKREKTPAEKLIDKYPKGDPEILTLIATATTCEDLQSWADASNAGFKAYVDEPGPAGDRFYAHLMASSDRLIDMSCPGW